MDRKIGIDIGEDHEYEKGDTKTIEEEIKTIKNKIEKILEILH